MLLNETQYYIRLISELFAFKSHNHRVIITFTLDLHSLKPILESIRPVNRSR
jgi:hypothetical protein